MLQFSDRTSEELPLPLAWKLSRKQSQMPSGHYAKKHQVKCLEPTMIYVLNGDVVHQTLELQLGRNHTACQTDTNRQPHHKRTPRCYW